MVDDGSAKRTTTCGSLLDAEEFRTAPKVLLPSEFPHAYRQQDTGRSFSLANLPAVARQGTAENPGSPGSCEAQSYGYGLGSFTAALNPDGTVKWDAAQPENEASPAWLYAWELKRQYKIDSKTKCPDGTLALPYLAHLVVYGCPSVSDVPYHPRCDYVNNIPLRKSFPDSDRMRIGTYYALNITDSSMLTDLKMLLSAGYMIAFSGPVLEYYNGLDVESMKKYLFNDGVGGIITSDGQTRPNSGHGQLLVGWDDDVGPSGQTGAFLVQNSFGTDWPPQDCNSAAPAGMAYWSYRTFFASQQHHAAIALPLDQTVFDNVSLTAQDGRSVGSATALQLSFDATVLIVQVQFDEPLLIRTITLTEPGTGSTMQGQFGHPMNNGWVYFRRDDGQAFVAGDWQVAIGATNPIDDEALTLSGAALTVPAPGPSALQPTALSSGLVVYDTIGEQARITVGS